MSQHNPTAQIMDEEDTTFVYHNYTHEKEYMTESQAASLEESGFIANCQNCDEPRSYLLRDLREDMNCINCNSPMRRLLEAVNDMAIGVIVEDYIVENSFERGDGIGITFKHNGQWKVMEIHIVDNVEEDGEDN